MDAMCIFGFLDKNIERILQENSRKVLCVCGGGGRYYVAFQYDIMLQQSDPLLESVQ